MIGMRVVRGPSWSWANQDGGEGHVGTVIQLEGGDIPKNTVLVQWDTGNRSNYRVGHNGQYDLYVLDSAPAGIKHPGHNCSECQVEIIHGTRWRCAQCDATSLCTECYMKPRHSSRHKFYRHDDDHNAPELVGPRSSDERLLQSYGFFKGAKVVRGINWRPEWGDQDGGRGKEGTILSIGGNSSENDRSVALVEWANGRKDRYRIGHNGKIDLKCVRPGRGMLYYRSHLRQCGKPGMTVYGRIASKQPLKPHTFNVGDRVRFTLPDDILKDLLRGHGEWHPNLIPFRGKTGIVTRILDKGDVKVQYKSARYNSVRKNSHFTFYPAALEHVEGQTNNSSDFQSKAASSMNNLAQRKDSEVRNPLNTNTHLAGENPSSSAPDADRSISTRLAQISFRDDADSVSSATSSFSSSMTSRERSIHAASQSGENSIIWSLLEGGVDVNLPDDRGLTPLHHAVIGNRPLTLKYLVRRCKANVNVSGENPPLHIASKQGYLDAVKMLLDLGVKVNQQDVCGNTALHCSIINNREEVSVFLCSIPDVDFDLRDNRRMTSLHLAAIKGNKKIVSLILNKSPSLLNAAGGEKRQTPLHLAVSRGHPDVARLLIDRKCYVDVADADGNSPLHCACERACLACAEMLVTEGANLAARNAKGQTCIMTLQSSPYRSVVIPEREPFPQISKILTRFNQTSGRNCDIVLLLACFLSWHGAALEEILNKEWLNCLKHCSRDWRQESSSSSLHSAEYVKSLEQQVQRLNKKIETHQCGICMDRDKEVIFSCGHGLCEKCSTQVTHCPVCRKPIKDKIKMY